MVKLVYPDAEQELDDEDETAVKKGESTPATTAAEILGGENKSMTGGEFAINSEEAKDISEKFTNVSDEVAIADHEKSAKDVGSRNNKQG